MEQDPLNISPSMKAGDFPLLDKAHGMSAKDKPRIQVFWEYEPSPDAQERLLAAFEMLFTDVALDR